MENSLWKCVCGKENTGKYCGNCGRERMVVPPINEEEQRKKALMAEKRRNMQSAIKKWAGSWVVLVLAILASAAALFSAISLIMEFIGIRINILSVISKIVGLIIAIIVCAGFWRGWAMGRDKSNSLNAGGAKLLRGVLIYNQVMMYISMILMLLLSLVLVIWGSQLIDAITGTIGSMSGTDLSGLAAFGTVQLVIGLVFVVILFVFQIIYYVFVRRFARNVVQNLSGLASGSDKSMMPAAVFMFIMAAFTLVTNFAGQAIAGALGPIVGFAICGTSLFTSLDVLTILSVIITATMMVFGGILIILYNNILNKQKSAN